MTSELDKFAARYELDVDHLRRWVIEAMVLGAVSDGAFDRRESDQIVAVISTRPEFSGMDIEALRADMERAFDGLMNDGFHVRIHALAAALPRYAHRVLAYRSAVVMAFANGRLVDDEFAFLRQMQQTLGIAEVDVAKAFDDAQDLGDDARLEIEPEPVEAYLDCLLMAAAVDRQLAEEELATIIAFVISREEFDGIPEDHLRRYINERLALYAGGAIVERLETLAADLPRAEHRENAYGLAAAMVVADGDLVEVERRFLGGLQQALSLDETRAELVLRSLGRA